MKKSILLTLLMLVLLSSAVWASLYIQCPSGFGSAAARSLIGRGLLLYLTDDGPLSKDMILDLIFFYFSDPSNCNTEGVNSHLKVIDIFRLLDPNLDSISAGPGMCDTSTALGQCLNQSGALLPFLCIDNDGEAELQANCTACPHCASGLNCDNQTGQCHLGCTDADNDGYGAREGSYGLQVGCAFPEPDCNDADASISKCFRVFVTSGRYRGNEIGNMLSGDATCQDLADTQALGGTWHAWLSSGGTVASLHLNHSSYPYMLLNKTFIAMNWNDLTDGTLNSRINIDEEGVSLSPGFVWTGTQQTGGNSGYHCSGWSTSSGYGTAGNSGQKNYVWTTQLSNACSSLGRIYCFEQPACGSTVEVCADTKDNNCDGLVDCADPQCMSTSCSEDCDDGFDNDADSLLDCHDSTCSAFCGSGSSGGS